MRLLIDGDILAFRAGFACEKTKYLVHAGGVAEELIYTFDDAKAAKEKAAEFGDGTVWSRKELEPEDKALMLVDVMLGDIYARYAEQAPDLCVYLTGVGNFRSQIATRAVYKGNRAASLPPTHLKAIRAHLIDKHKAIVSAQEEADDLLGIAMTEFPDSVLVSIDKDLMQLPGRHYNFVTKEEVNVSPKEAVLNFYCQVLTGDSTDNILGLSGIGPVKAKRALENCNTPLQCWQKCVEMYKAEFGKQGENYAVECAQLVFVRRKRGQIWDFGCETNKGKKETVAA